MARNLGTLTLNLIAQTARLTNPIRDAGSKVNSASKSMSNDINQITKSIRGAEGQALSFRGALMTIGAAVGVTSIKNISDEYLNLQNRLKLVTESNKELNGAMKSTLAAAQASAIDWAASAEIYSKVAANTRGLKLSQEELGKITETIAKSISISGVSSDEASRSMVQLGQAFSLGKLQGQDFKSVMQQTPAVMKAVSIGLGKTTGELLQMATSGELTNKVLIEAFQKSAPEIAKMYDSTATTISGGLTTIKNAAIAYAGGTDDAIGASKALVNALLLVSENFGEIAAVMGVGIWIALTKAVTGQVVAMQASIATKVAEISAIKASTAAKVAESAQDVISARAKVGSLASERSLIIEKLRGNVATAEKIALEARATQVAIQLAVAERGLTAATAAQTVAVNANAAATSRANAAKTLFLGLTGGWVGLGVAVASVAAGYFLFSDRSKEAEKVIQIEGNTVSELSQKYRELNEAQKDNESRALAKEIDDLSTKFRVASSDLSGFIESLPISDEKINQYRKINNEFIKISGSLRGNPDSYYSAMKSVGVLSDKQLEKVYSLAKAYDSSRKSLDSAKSAQDALSGSMEKVNNAATNQEKAILAQAEAVAKAQEIYKKANESNSLDASMANMEARLLKTGAYTKAQIDIMTKWAKEYNFSQDLMKTDVASNDLKERLALLNVQQQNSKQVEAINDGEKKRLKLIEEQAKVQQKQALYAAASSKENQNMLKVYSAFMSTGVLTSKQASYLTSEVGREGDFKDKNIFGSHTDKNNNATNIGFISWQGTRAKELKKFLGSMDLLDDKGQIKQTQEALNAQAQFLVKELLSGQYEAAAKALSSDDYSKLESTIGKKFILWDYVGNKIDAAPHHKKRDAYYKQITNLVGGGSGGDISSIISQITAQSEKIADQQKKALENQAEIQAKYFSEAERRASDHNKAIQNIQSSFVGNDAEIKRLTEMERERYSASEAAAKLQQENELVGWSWVGEQKIKKDAELKRALALANADYDKAQRDAAIKSIDEQYAHEISAHKKVQEEKAKQIRLSIQAVAQASNAQMLDSVARANMNSFDYGMFQIQGGIDSGMSGAQSDFEKREQEILAMDEFNQYIIDSETTRNELLLQAEEEYQSKKAAIIADAQEKQKELHKAQVESQILGVSALLGATTNLVGAYLGEASGAYKTLYGVQKAYNTAIAAMNVWTAASQAYAQSASPTVWGRAADAAIAAAQAQGFSTLIQNVAPVGMAHNGMSSIPREGTWLLDGGERVVSPRQNQDLTQMINNFNGSGGQVSTESNTKILNIIDRDELVGEYMRGSAGEKIMLNYIKSNATTVKRMLG